MTTLSVVIPTKNAGPLFRDVLTGIAQQQLAVDLDLVIIDSGSTDSTLQLAQEFGAKIVCIPPNEFNHGLTRNRAIEASLGEFIVLMTQDAVPGDNALVLNLLKPFADPMVAGVYARQIPRPNADVLTKRNLTNWLTGKLERREKCIELESAYHALSPFDRYLFCNFDNVCSAIRRRVWEEIKFRENDFGEDIDWSVRALLAGWKIVYEPTAFVVHSHDRPLSYEYKRTYMCHRTLFRQFGLCTVPSLSHVAASTMRATVNDWTYAVKNERDLWKRLRLLAKIPFLSLANVYGQYRGARDEKFSRGRKLSGV